MATVELIEYKNAYQAYKISNSLAEAVVSPEGAHVLSFTPAGASDVLWLSEKSFFEHGKAVRGGIPVCWPWFGPAGTPAHGIARINTWTLAKTCDESDGSTTLVFTFTDTAHSLEAELRVNAGTALTLELKTTNRGTETYHLTQALHTYFNVEDISATTVDGLDECEYKDMLTGMRLLRQGKIDFHAETDTLYDSNNKIITIQTPSRRIKVERAGSQSSIVWNPWTAKAARMADFGDDEYKTMLCVEAANAGLDAIDLAPGASHTLGTRISLI